MNRRIKKKLLKKNNCSISKYDLDKQTLIPISRSYQDIKTCRKMVHESITIMKRLEFDFDKRLRLKRTVLRQDYFKAIGKRFKQCEMKIENRGFHD